MYNQCVDMAEYVRVLDMQSVIKCIVYACLWGHICRNFYMTKVKYRALFFFLDFKKQKRDLLVLQSSN